MSHDVSALIALTAAAAGWTLHDRPITAGMLMATAMVIAFWPF